jgi:hypothetical protein
MLGPRSCHGPVEGDCGYDVDGGVLSAGVQPSEEATEPVEVGDVPIGAALVAAPVPLPGVDAGMGVVGPGAAQFVILPVDVGIWPEGAVVIPGDGVVGVVVAGVGGVMPVAGVPVVAPPAVPLPATCAAAQVIPAMQSDNARDVVAKKRADFEFISFSFLARHSTPS